ncbi:hypothetical protein [Pseudomonas sp.]
MHPLLLAIQGRVRSAWVGEDACNGKNWQGKKDEAGITKTELERLRLAY